MHEQMLYGFVQGVIKKPVSPFPLYQIIFVYFLLLVCLMHAYIQMCVVERARNFWKCRF